MPSAFHYVNRRYCSIRPQITRKDTGSRPVTSASHERILWRRCIENPTFRVCRIGSLCISAPCYAPKQCRDENGNEGTVCTYNFQRFHVVVTFLNGQSQSELYYRSDNKRLVSVEILKLQSMTLRGNYVWTVGNGMFVLVDAQRRGKPIAIAARFPDTTYPSSFHICTAEFVRKFGVTPKVKTPTGQKQS
jgi:hypothetical protein